MAVVRFPGGNDSEDEYGYDYGEDSYFRYDSPEEEDVRPESSYRRRDTDAASRRRDADAASRRRDADAAPRRGSRARSRESDDYIDEQIERGEELREKRRLFLRIALRVLAACACAAVAVGFFMYLAAQRVYSTASSQAIYETSMQEDVEYLALNGNIVYYSKDGVSCLSRKGAMVWSLSYEMQKPLVSTAGDRLAIADYGGSTIYLQSSSEIIGTIGTDLPIRSICASESGRIAAVLYDADVTWVYLFSEEGDIISTVRLSMSVSGYPISVALSPDGERMCVSHLTADSEGIGTSVAFYNFGSVGQNYADNNVSSFDYDEIVPYTRYMSDSACVAVSDSRLVIYTGSEIPESSVNVMFSQELEGVFAGEDYIGLLFPDSSGEEDYVLQIYDTNGNVTGTISFSQAYTDIRISGERVYIHNDTELLMYTVSGQLRYDGEFPESVYQIIPAASGANVLFIVTEDAIEKMTLQ